MASAAVGVGVMMSASRPLLLHVEQNPCLPPATWEQMLASQQQKYLNIGGDGLREHVHHKPVGLLAFAWGDDQPPDILRPYCEYGAVVDAMHNEDYVNKVFQ